MNKLLCFLAVSALCLAAPLTAGAEKLDMGKLTCKDFNAITDESEMTMLYFWLDGYVSHASKNTVMDTDSVEADLNAISEACKSNGGKKLLDVVMGQ